jgi:hypothetical protein
VLILDEPRTPCTPWHGDGGAAETAGRRGTCTMLLLEMIALGLVTFAAVLGFIRFCEWV